MARSASDGNLLRLDLDFVLLPFHLASGVSRHRDAPLERIVAVLMVAVLQFVRLDVDVDLLNGLKVMSSDAVIRRGRWEENDAVHFINAALRLHQRRGSSSQHRQRSKTLVVGGVIAYPQVASHAQCPTISSTMTRVTGQAVARPRAILPTGAGVQA